MGKPDIGRQGREGQHDEERMMEKYRKHFNFFFWDENRSDAKEGGKFFGRCALNVKSITFKEKLKRLLNIISN